MTEKKAINFSRGWPAPRLLPAELLKAAAVKTLSDPSVFVPGLEYGPDPGYEPLLLDLAAWLGKAYGVEPDPARLCITGGASQSLACVLQSFTEPAYTQAVWAVAPCYYLACPIFEDAGFAGRLRAVPEDEEGVDLEWLENGLKQFEGKGPDAPVYKKPGQWRKAYKHIVYCVPTCANPSGKTMSLRRREELVRLARKYDALILCDDVYDFLQWPTTTETTPVPSLPLLSPLLPRLVDIDRALGPSEYDPPGRHFGHALSNGSFSKLLGPGMRTGWVEGTSAMAFGVAQTGSTKSGGAPSQFSAMIVREVLAGGELDVHLRDKVRPALQARHALLVTAVKKELGKFGATVLESAETQRAVHGGYFVWVTLPGGKGLTTDELSKRALQEENVRVSPGSFFEVHGDEASVQFPNSFRLCFSYEDEDMIVEGVARLGALFKRIYDGQPPQALEMGSTVSAEGDFK
ncbi:PLP-dependent transferase [Thozetella sp. PMI_491]|nr:PLP-dependent transferase [Thozetella sp. PMI_491]